MGGFKIPKVNSIVLPVAQRSPRWGDKRVQSNSEQGQSWFRAQLTACSMCFQSVTGARLAFFLVRSDMLPPLALEWKQVFICVKCGFQTQVPSARKHMCVFLDQSGNVRQVTCVDTARSGVWAMVEMLELNSISSSLDSTCSLSNFALRTGGPMVREPPAFRNRGMPGGEGCREGKGPAPEPDADELGRKGHR